MFTHSTKEQKKCIEEGLKNQNHIKVNIVPIDLVKYESNAYHICDRVQKKVPKNDSVGLNYTGGTKAMAVHAYRAIYEKRPDAFFSYLDPRSLKICIDRENNQPLEFDVPLELSLKELFKLHNNNYWLDHKPPLFQAFLPDTIAENFVEIYSNINLAESWKKWLKEELHSLTKKGEFWKREEDLKQIQTRGITIKYLPPKIRDILRTDLYASTDELRLDITQKRGFSSLTQVCEWLDGTWLESYVLQQIKKIEYDFNIKQSGMSFYIKDPEYKRINKITWEDEPRFEFDVAFIIGYQLFAISCTTSKSHKLCKQKLFEAHLRARQLGGDEARTALVCCSDTPGYIEDEIKFSIRDKKIRVFGREDLANLAGGIETWIKLNNQKVGG
ncbi:protein of unknown function (DUF1887) [Cylindrospermum stagnale PCC 7417]|uniref:DUF1887 family protein n=1 Tax=Cylindrospermum stagnale PCC 7417 TaxID=56107 RepID=K9X908_9NOST|nr:DUF1887 family CARF protein [Cylindrospermum stagnale]AFZ28137.1 protein of unknown function (DUF1887) [Cylindrospermum stagnale PCC 7417]